MQRLEDAGFKRRQAEILAEELYTATLELVTNAELIKALDAHANELTLWLGSIMAAMVALAITLSKLLG